MQILRKFSRYAPVPIQSVSADLSPSTRQIEVDGVVLGAAIEHDLGVRFVAADARVSEMDQSIWPNLSHAVHSARQLYKSGRRPSPMRARP